MMSNNLIQLVQNSPGNFKTLKKILNSAAYKELSLEEQANTLLTILENSAGNTISDTYPVQFDVFNTYPKEDLLKLVKKYNSNKS